MHTPTPEQQAIIDHATSTKDNILVEALAGTAKTTTLEMIARKLVVPTLYVAFNKRNIEELLERELPGHVVPKTFNSIGHGVWMQTIGKRFAKPDTGKTYALIKDFVNTLPQENKKLVFENWSELQSIVRYAKNQGYIPEGKFSHAKSFISRARLRHQFIDDELPDELFAYADKILTQSIVESYNGWIDFDDQVYMSVLFGVGWPKYSLIMADETQDLNPLNHAMLEKLTTERIIAVGDRYQSIYGFRGAVESGMDAIRDQYKCATFALTVSFRCPRKVVEEVRGHVPEFKAAEANPDGEVLRIREPIDPLKIELGSAVICRNNAPLIRLAFELIKAKQPSELVGFDLGKQLIKILKDLDPDDPFEALDRWREERDEKFPHRRRSTEDRYACLRIILDEGRTLKAAIAFAETIFKAKGSIKLLTGHKAKGLEWDTVYHLDSFLIGAFGTGEESRQENNLRYVINTRAKQKLIFVTTNGDRHG